ncbi:YybH family protein [Saccharothrix coeruleofusca]|uniref:SnoaL-like domain-containing protein n=1 Tax=Saccharothrix coeruleofusca TaxID=33919 RepID=A0A918AVF4_9PSEU|nr:nuclear transport factor 2 family protein [Saccharothrix coeruleofusca]MBP2335974.1 ketosteroid isomerase-like protein [Saccharothrix coeruleofusca]GGP76248.1 hypothetical protein GCM10010185_57420 [Saccharothrix coeruleofusca]
MTNASDVEVVGALHRDWVFGWERNPGDAPFDFRDVQGARYDWDFDGVVLYDDFDPAHRVARGAGEYAEIWEPAFRDLRLAHHRVAAGPDVVVSGDLAASWLVFVARLEDLSGTVTGIRTTTSLVWRRTGEHWKIVREHNSSVVLEADELDAAMADVPVTR